jgi:hypothetical protein
MKSQDLLVLFKLASLESTTAQTSTPSRIALSVPGDWQGWDAASLTESIELRKQDEYTVRALAQSTGVSKSEVSASIQRSRRTGLLLIDGETNLPRINASALCEFAIHGLKYVFPAVLGGIERGVPTAHQAPVLAGKLLGTSSQGLVWPDPGGNKLGQSITPLHPGVLVAVRQDANLYAMLALVDSIRVGRARELTHAAQMLRSLLGTPQ